MMIESMDQWWIAAYAAVGFIISLIAIRRAWFDDPPLITLVLMTILWFPFAAVIIVFHIGKAVNRALTLLEPSEAPPQASPVIVESEPEVTVVDHAIQDQADEQAVRKHELI